MSIPVQGSDPVGGQIIRILLNLGQHVLDQNRRRHGPGGIERDVGNFGLKHRRTAKRLADLYPGTPDRLAVAIQRDLVPGDVDHDKSALEFVKQPTSPLHVHPDLIDPRINGHIQRRQGRRPRHAIRAKVLLGLILLHCRDDTVVVIVSIALRGRQVSTSRQTGTQLCDCRPGHSRLERLPFGNFRPTAGIAHLTQLRQSLSHAAVNRFLRRCLSEPACHVVIVERGKETVHVLTGVNADRVEIPVKIQSRRINFAAS
ncbi:hypothetical protein D3C85_825840 [compost metagenome]